MLENEPWQRMVERQLGERILVRRGLAGRRLFLDRQLLALEQDLLDLLRRAEVERLPRRLEGLLLQSEDLLAELMALRLELRAVEQHAVALHREEHRHKRQFDLVVDVSELLIGRNARLQNVVQREDAVGL